MSKAKGFAYTTFALLSASILMSIVFAQVYQPEGVQTANAERIGEASFFLDSVLSDMDRSLSIATRRSLTGATNYVVTEGEALSSPEKNVSSVLVNGTLGGQKVETIGNASLSEWTRRVSEIGSRSGYRLSISVANYSFEPQGFNTQASFSVDARLFDPTTLASFNRTASTSTDVSIEGVEDPMITLRSRGRYTTIIERCLFDDPAELLPEPSQNSSSVAYGSVVRSPTDGEAIDNQGEKIMVVQDADSYSYSYTSGFEGVIAAQTSSSPTQVNTNYALGTGSIDGLNESVSAVIDSEGYAWRTGFRQMFKGGCYVTSDTGPGLFDRLENNLTGDGNGVATLIEIPRLPSQLQKTGSAVGYIYFNESRSTTLNEVEGITGEYPWFRLDEQHVDEWGMNELVR